MIEAIRDIGEYAGEKEKKYYKNFTISRLVEVVKDAKGNKNISIRFSFWKVRK